MTDSNLVKTEMWGNGEANFDDVTPLDLIPTLPLTHTVFRCLVFSCCSRLLIQGKINIMSIRYIVWVGRPV